MSYTVAIHANNSIDGSQSVGTLAKTSSYLRNPSSPKKAEGFILNEGRTNVGVVWVPEHAEEISTVKRNLDDLQEKTDGRVAVRDVILGQNHVGVVNMLLPKPDFEWLGDVFKETKSKLWIMEQTGWWEDFGNDASVTPPGVVYPKDKSPLVVFRVGTVSDYFNEQYRDDPGRIAVYGSDERGYQFRREHQNEPISRVGDLIVADFVEKYGYDKGLQLFTTKEGTGLRHQYTVLYSDELQNSLECAHLSHESAKGVWEKLQTKDTEGNRLVIRDRAVAEGFLQNWPIKVDSPFQQVEGVVRIPVREGINYGIETHG